MAAILPSRQSLLTIEIPSYPKRFILIIKLQRCRDLIIIIKVEGKAKVKLRQKQMRVVRDRGVLTH